MTDQNFQIYVGTSITEEELEIGLALWTELNYFNRHDLMGKDKRIKIYEQEYREIIEQIITTLNLIYMIQLYENNMYCTEYDKDM